MPLPGILNPTITLISKFNVSPIITIIWNKIHNNTIVRTLVSYGESTAINMLFVVTWVMHTNITHVTGRHVVF
jgi:hypothetical protein